MELEMTLNARERQRADEEELCMSYQQVGKVRFQNTSTQEP